MEQVPLRDLMVMVTIKKRFKWTGFVCDKLGHRVKDCHNHKIKNTRANMIENIDEKVMELDYIVLEVFETFW